MNPAVRRFLALASVFVTMFTLVSALRIWRNGSLPGWLHPGASFRKEPYTLPTQAPLQSSDVELLTRLNAEYAKLTSAVVPSVVSIGTAGVRTERQADFTGRTYIRRYPTQGQGSGAIVTREGHVITNHHVIDGQQEIHVTCHNGKTYPAKLIGDDPLLDIAVLKISGGDNQFTPLKFGDSSDVQVGQLVLAIGNPFGLGETVTQGIISAKERSLSDQQRDLFQTDAAINPGNSGGPLVNLHGEIIGINVAIYSNDRENPGFQGVGFSIPSNDVRETMTQILERGRPVRGYLGLQMRDLDASVLSAIQYPGESAVTVLGVFPGSPGESAGIKPWDIVTAYNNEPVHGANQLINLIQRTKIGSTATLRIWRDGKEQDLKATIREGEPETSRDRSLAATDTLHAVGIELRDFTLQERMFGATGVMVTRVDDTGLAAGILQPGDRIFGVNDARVNDSTNCYLHLAASATRGETHLSLIRGNRTLRTTLPPLASTNPGPAH